MGIKRVLEEYWRRESELNSGLWQASFFRVREGVVSWGAATSNIEVGKGKFQIPSSPPSLRSFGGRASSRETSRT